MTTEKIEWRIDPAGILDVDELVKISQPYSRLIHPLFLGPAGVEGYIDQIRVARHPNSGDIIGYCHALRVWDNEERTLSYLEYIRQVPGRLRNVVMHDLRVGAFIGQIIGPPKTGIQRMFVEDLKQEYDIIWGWLSVKSPVLPFYRDVCGFEVDPNEYKFFNAVKGDFSTFQFLKWEK